MPEEADEQAHRWEPTAFGNFVFRRRKDLRMSQVDLGRLLHFSDSYISQIERGRLPDMDAEDFIGSWARALDVTPEVLITEGELWRYNLVPMRPGELTPGDRAVLAAIEHLPQETRHRIARSLRELYDVAEPIPRGDGDHQDAKRER